MNTCSKWEKINPFTATSVLAYMSDKFKFSSLQFRSPQWHSLLNVYTTYIIVKERFAQFTISPSFRLLTAYVMRCFPSC